MIAARDQRDTDDSPVTLTGQGATPSVAFTQKTLAAALVLLGGLGLAACSSAGAPTLDASSDASAADAAKLDTGAPADAGHDPADAGFALPDAAAPDAAALDAEGPDAGFALPDAEAADSGGNPDGAVDQRIVFIKNNNLYVMEADGTNPVNLTNDGITHYEDPQWSPDRSKILFTKDVGGARHIFVANPDATNQVDLSVAAGGAASAAVEPTWSPDGTQIAFSANVGGVTSIYAMDANGSNVRRLTNAPPASDSAPDWSPSGDRIAFHTNESAIGIHIAFVNADGTGRATTGTIARGLNPVWSPDGSKIAYRGTTLEGERIFLMNPDGSGQTRVTTATLAGQNEDNPAWSPDGSKLVFDRNIRGQLDVLVCAPDGSGELNLTSHTPGMESMADW